MLSEVAIAAASPDLTGVLLAAGACAIMAALIAAVTVKPRRQLLAPLSWSVSLSLVVYLLPPSIDGRGSFYVHLIIAMIVAIVAAIFLVRRCSQYRSLAGSIAVAVAGVSVPPLLLIAVLAAACAGTPAGGECIG